MNGRPDSAEAAAHYFNYIDQVAGEDIKTSLESQLKESLALFSGISEEKSLYRYAPEKWSIRETLNHITDTERAFVFRALWFGRGFQTPLPGYDQNIAAAGAGADQIPLSAHIEEFRQVRLSTISLFNNMPPEGWSRRGVQASTMSRCGRWRF